MRRDTTVVFAQTPLLKSQLEELKRVSGTTSTKDALQMAVNHYLSCPSVREREAGERKAEEEEGAGVRVEEEVEASFSSVNKKNRR